MIRQLNGWKLKNEFHFVADVNGRSCLRSSSIKLVAVHMVIDESLVTNDVYLHPLSISLFVRLTPKAQFRT